MSCEYNYALEGNAALKYKVSAFSWSPKTDLIAIGSFDGIVSVYRYRLRCVWSANTSPSNVSPVTSIAWHPEGKFLVAGYSTGRLTFFSVNDGYQHHNIELVPAKPINILTWTLLSLANTKPVFSNSTRFFPELTELSEYKDDSLFITSDMYKQTQRLVTTDEDLTILCAGHESKVYLFASDAYPLACLSFEGNLNQKLVECSLSLNPASLLMLFQTTNVDSGAVEIEFKQIPCPNLDKRRQQLFKLASHLSTIRICFKVLDLSFDKLRSSWQDVLLDLNSRFTTYAREQLEKNANWSLSVELMEFLLFGFCPPALNRFLVHDWTSNRFKRGGTSILQAYEIMKRITFQSIQFHLQRLLFTASELLGCVRDEMSYAEFGITEKAIMELIRTIGCAVQKSQEFYIVLFNLCAARFTYMTLCILYLNFITPFPPESFQQLVCKCGPFSNGCMQLSPVEQQYVVAFISNSLEPILSLSTNELVGFQLDKVQQYLGSGDVNMHPDSFFKVPKDYEARTNLRKLIEFTAEEVDQCNLPDGFFAYDAKISLADLIDRRLRQQVDALVSIPENDFNHGILDLQKITSPTLFKLNPVSLGEPSTTIIEPLAVKPTFSPNRSTSDSRFLTSIVYSCDQSLPPVVSIVVGEIVQHPATVSKFVEIVVDELPTKTGIEPGPFKVIQANFFTPDLLLVLVQRDSRLLSVDDVNKRTFSLPTWLVAVALNDSQANPIDLSLPRSSTWSNGVSVSKLLLSKLINQSCVEQLPVSAIQMTTNGERSIIAVLSKDQSSCRTYLLDKEVAEA